MRVDQERLAEAAGRIDAGSIIWACMRQFGTPCLPKTVSRLQGPFNALPEASHSLQDQAMWFWGTGERVVEPALPAPEVGASLRQPRGPVHYLS